MTRHIGPQNAMARPGAISGAPLVLMAAVLWGTTGTAQGLAPAGSHPFAVGTMRLVVGGMALFLLAWARGSLPIRSRWPLASTAWAAVFIAGYQLCFFGGVARTGVAVGTVVAMGTSPVAAGILGRVIRREPIRLRWGVATVLAVSGCALLTFSKGAVQVDPTGIGLAIGAGISYAVYTVAMKGILEQQAPEAAMAVCFSMAAVFLSPVLLEADMRWLMRPAGMAVALHLGVVATALAYWCFANGLRSLPVGNAASLSLAEPLTAAILGMVVLGERLSPPALTGIFLIFLGIVVLSVRFSVKSAPHP